MPFIFVFIIPAIFIPLTQYISGNPILQIIKILPTYYFADGLFNAIQKQGSFGGNVLDVSVTAGSAIVMVLLTLWVPRRQTSVAATI